jgi:hypothetical protein
MTNENKNNFLKMERIKMMKFNKCNEKRKRKKKTRITYKSMSKIRVGTSVGLVYRVRDWYQY